MKAIYGLYSDPGSAQRAVARLRTDGKELGIRPRDISVVSSEPYEEYDLGWREQKTPMPWLAALGGLVGGTSGYLLASLTQRAYPLPTGNMPIVALWPTGVIVYELTMLGAILVTFFTLLVGARLPNLRTRLQDPEVSAGKILVGVTNPPEDSRVELKQTLREAGASEVKELGP